MRALGPYSAWTPRGPWTRVIHRQRSAAARRGRVALPRIGPRLRPPVAVPEPPPGAGWSLAAPATGIAIAGPLACRADRTMAAMNWSLGSSAPPSATRRERERPDALRVPRGRWVRGPLRDRRHFKVDAVHACAVGSCSCQVRAADHLEKELTMLNERAREIHSFIQRFRREKGSAPTIREIGRQFGISSTNGVRYYLNLLEKAGYIRRTGGISRGIGTSSATATAAPGIPVLGRVAAGQPILAEENWSGSLELTDMFGETEQLFALQVRGDSMVDAGILPGDYVIVQKQETARAGEIVVAGLAAEATVKYSQPRRERGELGRANEKYEPIRVTADSDFRILGTVRGVVRTVGEIYFLPTGASPAPVFFAVELISAE